MNFGCSECLCIAIESHRTALLKSLLEPLNVVYRDMFWARQPIHGWFQCHKHCKESYPILHEINSDTDLSFVGRPDCGHTPEDVELLFPLTDDTTERVLVSLPMLAQWHSTSGFNAQKMLRDCGKFDFSELQLAHIRTGELFERQENYEDDTFDNHSILTISFDTSQYANAVRQRQFSTDPLCSLLFNGGTRATGRCLINPDMFHLELHFQHMEIAQIFSDMNYNGSSSINDSGVCSIVNLVQRQIENGADLNGYMAVRCVMSSGKHLDYSEFNHLEYIGLMSCLNFYLLKVHKVHFGSFQMLLNTLLRNGFSVFLDQNTKNIFEFPLLKVSCYFMQSVSDFGHASQLPNFSFFSLLFEVFGVAHLKFNMSICEQLLALGYGRRELRPHVIPVYDENLKITRDSIEFLEAIVRNQLDMSIVDSDESIFAVELQALVDSFDAGPLSLLQLSRIAVRRSIGGVHFVHHIKAISLLLPPLLYDYVADPTELLHSDYETPAKRSKLSK